MTFGNNHVGAAASSHELTQQVLSQIESAHHTDYSSMEEMEKEVQKLANLADAVFSKISHSKDLTETSKHCLHILTVSREKLQGLLSKKRDLTDIKSLIVRVQDNIDARSAGHFRHLRALAKTKIADFKLAFKEMDEARGA